jgi:uncharacterized membrane protein YphA (DoxX/SURF4 family)
MHALRELFTPAWVPWLALLCLCSAYLQGPLDKLRDFASAVAEMQHFGLRPAAPWAAFTIAFEGVASVMVLAGWHRWLGALALAGFTLMASVLADRFWAAPPRERRRVTNAFFEHVGLAGAFVLVAWFDLKGGSDVF